MEQRLLYWQKFAYLKILSQWRQLIFNCKWKHLVIDVEKQEDITAFYRVTEVPCYILLKNQQEFARQYGQTNDQEIDNLIKYAFLQY